MTAFTKYPRTGAPSGPSGALNPEDLRSLSRDPYPFAVSHAALAAASTLLATAFACCTTERWLARRRPHEAAWSLALVLFAAGAAAMWVGASVGWAAWNFKAFYYLGAIANVPVLALGTVWLLGRRRTAQIATVAVGGLLAFAAGLVTQAPLSGRIDPERLPQGSDVLGAGPRILAALCSGLGASVVLAGALLSAWRLLQARRSSGAATGEASPTRLAAANLVIAAGTLVLGAGGALNSVADEMDAFSLSLLAGAALLFAGFAIAATASPPSMPFASATPATRAFLIDVELLDPADDGLADLDADLAHHTPR